MVLELIPPPRIAISSYTEARALLAEWEKAEPDAAHIVLILDGKDTLSAFTGAMRPTEVAGLCFAAAQMAVE